MDTKIPVVCIELQRYDGPSEFRGEVTCLATPRGSCWQHADAVLRAWALNAPADGTYHQVFFTVRYADGRRQPGRLTLTFQHVLWVGEILARHVGEYARYHAGQARPDWLTEELYQQVMRTDAPAWRQFLARYEIPGQA